MNEYLLLSIGAVGLLMTMVASGVYATTNGVVEFIFMLIGNFIAIHFLTESGRKEAEKRE